MEDKAEGEALGKINAANQGEGLWAYIIMHQWFCKATDSGRTNRRIEITRPNQCKHGWEIASAVEKWEEKYRISTEVDRDPPIPPECKITALKCLLVGDIKRHIELQEEEMASANKVVQEKEQQRKEQYKSVLDTTGEKGKNK